MGLSLNILEIAKKIQRLEKNGSQTLPTASADTKGGIKIGQGLTMTGDVLSVSSGGGGDKTYGTPVSITSATEQSKYTCPSDGIVILNPVSPSDNHYIKLKTSSIGSEDVIIGSAYGHAGSGQTVLTIPVLKGTQLYIEASTGTATPIAEYVPYTEVTRQSKKHK